MKIAGNNRLEVHAVPAYQRAKRDIIHHNLVAGDCRASFAMSMIEKWGMVSARPGESGDVTDERGLALLSPEDVVERAVAITDLAFASFEKLGWMVDVPGLTDIQGEEEAE